MIAICKKGTKKLIKGVRYEIENLWNDGSNQRWMEGKVEIKNIGRFTVNNFTDIDGKDLPKRNILSSNPRPLSNILKFNEVKVGDILVCTTDRYKNFAKDCKYQIENLLLNEQERRGWNNATFIHREERIKFVGIPRTIKFSGWCFRKLSTEENRQMSLTKILTGEEVDVVKDKHTKKLDLVANKELELMSQLSKSIIDPNRHHLSIIDWACQKSTNNLNIDSNDFESILGMTLKDILTKIENK